MGDEDHRKENQTKQIQLGTARRIVLPRELCGVREFSPRQKVIHLNAGYPSEAELGRLAKARMVLMNIGIDGLTATEQVLVHSVFCAVTLFSGAASRTAQ
jgi:hypothetical protein